MRNRAKCKLCGDILESFHRNDYVKCSCDEISIDGGQSMFRCGAKNWSNFLRVDDNGKEIEVTIKDKDKDDTTVRSDASTTSEHSISSDTSDSSRTIHSEPINNKPNITRQSLLEELDMMMKNIESLPPNAMTLPINHYDFYSFMLVVSSIFRAS